MIGLPRLRRCSGAGVNYRAWTTKKDEEDEEEDGASNEHLFGDKMRFIVGRFRSRALREVLDQIVRLKERGGESWEDFEQSLFFMMTNGFETGRRMIWSTDEG